MLQINIEKDIYFQNLKSVFDDMAKGYDTVANQFAFDCKGCTDSCCLTLFYHHTLIEYLYLKQGLSTLDNEVLKEVRIKSEAQIGALKRQEPKKPFRKMCPLNIDGLCILYDYRPMICRLHGVYHELRKPGGPPLKGPGCDLFMDLSESKDYNPLDRTPFYIQLASLEKQLREETGMNQRIKMTIAEIILD
jgi:Fe-S-cluster containining protein